MLSGWIFESAPPVTITSALPRAMIRAASATARLEEASASVIELLGPWQSIRMEMWQASMLGRYFSSQIGSMTPIPSRPHTGNSNCPVFDEAIEIAGASSSRSVEISPAPRSMPIRVGSTPPSTRPASLMARWAAATASWMSRAMYFRLLPSALRNLGRA